MLQLKSQQLSCDHGGPRVLQAHVAMPHMNLFGEIERRHLIDRGHVGLLPSHQTTSHIFTL